MKRLFFPVFAILISILYFSCKKTPNDSYYDTVSCNEPDDTLNTYSLKIGAIFNSSCTQSGCHNNDSHKGKVNLEGYDNCVKAFNNKDVLCTIYQDKGCKPMPKGSSKLSDDAIHNITCWAKNGYPK